MKNVVVSIDAGKITDAESFHSVFAEAFGFPDFYGRNMSAWIDCMTSLDAPQEGMSRVHAPPGHVVVIDVAHAREFARRLPGLYADLVECSSFVNRRRMERGNEPVLALSF